MIVVVVVVHFIYIECISLPIFFIIISQHPRFSPPTVLLLFRHHHPPPPPGGNTYNLIRSQNAELHSLDEANGRLRIGGAHLVSCGGAPFLMHESGNAGILFLHNLLGFYCSTNTNSLGKR